MLKNCIKNWEKIHNDMAADMAQREHNNIKCYASTFSNINIESSGDMKSWNEMRKVEEN